MTLPASGTKVDGGTKSWPSSAALDPVRGVKLSGGKLAHSGAGEGNLLVGILRERIAAADVNAAVDLLTKEGTFVVECSGAVSALARLYPVASGRFSATANYPGEKPAFIALEAGSGTGSRIEAISCVLALPASRVGTSSIWLDAELGNDTYGDGSADLPVKTIEAAWALLTAARNTIFVQPGTYVPTATLTMPHYTVNVVGMGGPNLVIIGGGDTGAAHVFTHAAGVHAATTYYLFKDLDINHGATYDGVRVDQTTAGNKLFFYFDNVEMEGEGSTGRPFNLHTHGDNSQAVKLIANGGVRRCEWEGEVYFAVNNSSDLIDIRSVRLTGGFIQNTQATAMCGILEACIIPATHATGGASQHVINVGACYTQSGNNLTKAVAADIGGAQTVRICTGAAA